MKLNEIHIRDPFIMLYEDKYYLYGSRMAKPGKARVPGFDVYVSDDLVDFSQPKEIFSMDNFWADQAFWAPEVYEIDGRFYLFGTFRSPTRRMCCQVLSCDRPDGTFTPVGEPITGEDRVCLDGTLYYEDGVPYMVFCHEWTQLRNGTICAVEMEKDFSKAKGEPFLLFSANEAPWIKAQEGDGYITDGCFMYKKDGELYMLWSSFTERGYCEAVAKSESGRLKGPWVQSEKPLASKDEGHGMIFKDKQGNEKLILHKPNAPGFERPVIYDFISVTEIR